MYVIWVQRMLIATDFSLCSGLVSGRANQYLVLLETKIHYKSFMIFKNVNIHAA